MMDVLLYAFITIVVIVMFIRYGEYCYRMGTLSTVGALNILCEESESGFLFYNLLNNTFITQNVDYDIGVSHLKSMYPNTDIVVSMAKQTRIIDEAV